jgi:hypothetical protein
MLQMLLLLAGHAGTAASKPTTLQQQQYGPAVLLWQPAPHGDKEKRQTIQRRYANTPASSVHPDQKSSCCVCQL